MINGTVYGVALNDRDYLEKRTQDFHGAPYGTPPVAPVLYIKPRGCVVSGSAAVQIPASMPKVETAATIALLFGNIFGVPVAAALALDISEPHSDFYRPAIKQRCRDGFLPLGEFVPWSPALLAGDISTRIGAGKIHRWSPTRSLRNPAELIAELGGYMTLSDGDVLLIGLAGDAPLAEPLDVVEVSAQGLPSLNVRLERERTL